MILAPFLVAPSATSVTAARRLQADDLPPIEAIVAEANRKWYALPQATSTFTATLPDGSTMQLREARTGEKLVFKVLRDDLVNVAIYGDGAEQTALDFGARRYHVWTDKEILKRDQVAKQLPPLPARQKDYAEVSFASNRGLVFRVDPAIPIVSDGEATVDGTRVRRVVGHVEKPYTDEERPGGVIDVTMDLDASGGWIRTLEFGYKPKDPKGSSISFRFACEPKIAADEAFTVDVTRLSDWERSTEPFRIGGS